MLPPSNFYPILLSLKNTELNFVWEKIKQSILKVVPTPSLCFSIIVSYCNNFVPHLSSINPMVGYSNYALQTPPIAYWLFESYLPGPPPQYPTKVIIYIYMLQPPLPHTPLCIPPSSPIILKVPPGLTARQPIRQKAFSGILYFVRQYLFTSLTKSFQVNPDFPFSQIVFSFKLGCNHHHLQRIWYFLNTVQEDLDTLIWCWGKEGNQNDKTSRLKDFRIKIIFLRSFLL